MHFIYIVPKGCLRVRQSLRGGFSFIRNRICYIFIFNYLSSAKSWRTLTHISTCCVALAINCHVVKEPLSLYRITARETRVNRQVLARLLVEVRKSSSYRTNTPEPHTHPLDPIEHILCVCYSVELFLCLTILLDQSRKGVEWVRAAQHYSILVPLSVSSRRSTVKECVCSSKRRRVGWYREVAREQAGDRLMGI